MAEKRIVIVDNEPAFSDFVKDVLNEEEFKVSEVVGTKADFFRRIGQASFDIAIIDISLGGREGGIEILHILKEKNVQLPAIIFSSHSEIDYGFKCLEAGAKGYVNKAEIYSSLVQALNEVSSGNLFVSGNRGRHIVNQFKIKEGRYAK